MGILQSLRIAESFIAAHEEAEDVADEHLLNASGVGKSFNHFERVVHLAVQNRIAGPCNRTSCDGGRAKFITTIAAKVVEAFQGQPEWIHLAVHL